MTDELKPTPDPAKPKRRMPKPEQLAEADTAKANPAPGSSEGKNANPITLDETYSELRDENRVVMRRTIAINLESFRAAPADFDPRPQRTYPSLQAVTAPFFSVIVPTYNGEQLLPSVLDALRAQTFGDFETIVIDDASADGSALLVEHSYPEVRLLVNRRNLGFVGSCNTAATAAYGRYIVLLNNDTEPEPGWLAELAKVIVANPDAGIIASKLLLFDRRDTLHTTGDMLGRDGIPRNRGVWELDQGQYDGATAVFSGCGGASAYRKDLWQALGGFDDDFWMYMEDADFAFRAQLLGFGAVFAPHARVYHRLSASGGDTLASYYVGRNTIWMIAKNMPRGLVLHNWGAIVGAQVAIALDALRNWRGTAAQARLRGQLAGIAGLPRQLAKRRTIQPRRQIEDAQLDEMLVEPAH